MKVKLNLPVATLFVLASTVVGAGSAMASVNTNYNCENRKDCHQSITLTKVFSPHTSVPSVDLSVTNSATNFTQTKGLIHDGDSVTFKVDQGTHVISENGSVLKNYTASIDCGETSVTKTGDFSWSYFQHFDEDVSCTITNSLAQGGQGGGTVTPPVTTPTTTTPTTTGGQGGGTVAAAVTATPTGGVNAGSGTMVVNTASLAGLLGSIVGLGFGLRRLHKPTL